jgi:hypothetical protein
MGVDTQEVLQGGYTKAVEPYMTSLIGRSSAIVAKDKWEKYTGKRFADFTPEQQEYFKKATKMGVDPRTLDASKLTSAGIDKLSKQTYGQSNFAGRGTNVNPLKQKTFLMGKTPTVKGQGDWRNQINQGKAARDTYDQKLKNFKIKNADDIKQLKPWQVKNIKAAQATYNEKLKNFDIKGIKNVTAPKNLAAQTAKMKAAQTGFKDKVGTKSFTTAAAQAGMSPYMQSVVGIQQREAQRQADIAGTERSAKAVQAGAFGGSRQAIMDAEAAKNLAQQQGDIQAQGSQKAYEDAQQQFNQQQQLGLTAQQSNQQTGLQAALANMNSKQQANVQNQAAINQSMGMSKQMAMQAAIQNQQTQLQQKQSNQRGRLETQGLGSGNKQQIKMQNLQNQQQTAITNQANQLMADGKSREQAIQIATQNQTQRFSREIANQQAKLGVQQLDSGNQQQIQMQNLQNKQQAAMANAQRDYEALGMSKQQAFEAAKINVGNQFTAKQINQQAKYRTQEFESGQNLTAQQYNQANRLEREKQDEASRQYGAEYSYRGSMGALQGANQLAGLGRDAYGQRVNNLGLLKDVGGMRQGYDQNLLNVDYQNELDRKNYQYQQMGFERDMISGIGNNMTTRTMYQNSPSMTNQILGAGAAYAGYQQSMPNVSVPVRGGAAGGMVPSGLVDLAMYRAYA